MALPEALLPALLALHKILLATERQALERVHGALSAAAFLQIVSDPLRYGWLKEAGRVDERRNGSQRLYRARPQGLAELKAFLDSFWDAKLDALPREAQRQERGKRGKHN